ncbi:hypothetical protein HaLaN_00207 [Haematococcus lacustris]|uniref:Uncharacterized protein n=1 Tax=Haematococcus lacustris TaxID=44745 RepID=A0A699YFF8_HAELA|nr:hypothetical protein HaLaN_00207 [Haematococcus lacustris]
MPSGLAAVQPRLTGLGAAACLSACPCWASPPPCGRPAARPWPPPTPGANACVAKEHHQLHACLPPLLGHRGLPPPPTAWHTRHTIRVTYLNGQGTWHPAGHMCGVHQPLALPLPLYPWHSHLLDVALQDLLLRAAQPHPLLCPLGVQVIPPHCIPGGHGDGHMPLDGHLGDACWGGCCQVLQLELDVAISPLSVAASLDQAAVMLQLAPGHLAAVEAFQAAILIPHPQGYSDCLGGAGVQPHAHLSGWVKLERPLRPGNLPSGMGVALIKGSAMELS